ncbi:NAD(P)/FAD-dependent oxidoreductase [Flavivirga jejuensis]|uniref:FAD-dependent monooxygenase n=1 Tax=Flavivirga jejuensis TaxID=870487 RepID=A0ABT8WKZ4_9FLAO|nr:FAD-dependent monooxygenase [Flavivirga jejuensis]MDO5973659.1 FAD-dependent monooxygenase [Flavivirga jejuensis]
MDQKTDILIIGGGIAGCIAAISLIDTYHVTLIDKLSEPKERIGESLAPAALRILKQLDLLDGMKNQLDPIYQTNFGMQSYWGSDQVHIVDHLRNPDGFVKNLNRKAFESYLRKSAEKRGVKCSWNTQLYKSTYLDSKWEVQVKSNDKNSENHSISASFVIDASGRQSHFARSLGVKRQIEDKLIACWITLPNNTENTMSTISASEHGWWYSSVVPNNKRIVAFHTDADLITKNEFKTTKSFLKLSKGNKEISELLKSNENTIEFQGTVAANSTKLEQVADQQWAALGDAAISFDPLSSQGMFHAMASALQLKELIIKFDFIADLNSQKMEKFKAAYTNQIEEIWKHYLKHKKIFYGVEMRWKEASFWRRRHDISDKVNVPMKSEKMLSAITNTSKDKRSNFTP